MTMTIVDSVLHAIGSTPIVRLRRLPERGSADVLVKLEYYNPTGSYKDRMALAMIEGAEARGALRPGMRVIEFTGGSTGSSLALGVRGERLSRSSPVSSDAFAKEKLDTMRAFGADLRVVPSDGGKDHAGAVRLDARRGQATLCEEPDTFWTDQFHNDDAIDGYMGIGRELLEQTGGALDAFCGAVGTGGMLAGVSQGAEARRLLGADRRARAGVGAAADEGPRRRAPRRRHGAGIRAAAPDRATSTTKRARSTRPRRAGWRGGSRGKKGFSPARRRR